MKRKIHVTQQDNRDYFDNKLSQKHEILVIERIIRNIHDNTGIVTRRGKSPLEVIMTDGQWKIKGEAEEHNTRPNTAHKSKSKGWDNLTNHEQILLTAVRFDLFDEWDECEQAAQEAFNIGEASLDGIPRFIIGQVYTLDGQKYKIANNNGKRVSYYGPEGEKRATLEADTFGEFIRIENSVLHSVDFVE